MNKLNKITAIKVFIIVLIIIAVEVVSGFIIYHSYSEHTYKITYSEYDRQISEVAEDVSNKLGENIALLSEDETVLSEVEAVLTEKGTFSDFVIFSEASNGRIVGNGWKISGYLTDYGIDYKQTDMVEISGTVYVFASSRLSSSSYYVGALIDFSDQMDVISSMLDNLVAYMIIASVFILAAFLFYAFWAGAKQRKARFDYKLLVNGEGKILSANGAFRKEFPYLKNLKTDISEITEKSYNILKLSGKNGDKLLVIKTYKKSRGKILICASPVLNASTIVDLGDGNEDYISNVKARASLSKTFEDFSSSGKRTLLGLLHIVNLTQIGTLFGKEMSLNIQKTVLQKAKEKFTFVYELDLGLIGVVYPDGKNLDILLADIEDNLQYVSQPIHMEDNLFTVELKSGFALCDASMENLTFDYAMKAAEAAYQRIIDTKIADYVIYHEAQKKLYAKYFITYNIREMLAEGAFEMEYQPQYNIKENRIEGFEALFRVKKSWNVNVDTFSFITYAERTGAMVQLGEFIFDTGMSFAKKLEGKNVSVSLNVSPVQLMQDGFTENFLKLYRKYDLKPGSVCVEITESFLMKNFEETLKKLQILRNNGIYVHLDDFGTEYSSLLYIKKLPISTIKIDKEFIRDVIKNKESQAVIKFITNIAKLLDLTTICEGVETTAEFDMLNALGCDTIQGWLIGKSMKPDDALKIVDHFDYFRDVLAKKSQN